ncbi:hypothetical protein [Exercitatus varius]|uniref:hypothetical protein n=1 Tax=Exercitatus varius TaxID=67857 RepID=UPI00294B1562|nr:hypothetical protein [Exercitatus varius]MDG2958961.1 hypothetical protein [Exercitatus varius]
MLTKTNLKGLDMSICNKNHRYADILNNIPYSQSHDNGRHKCAGCAYELGLQDGLNNIHRDIEQLDLPYSQAGTARHKSAVEAYQLGWSKGQKDYQK